MPRKGRADFFEEIEQIEQLLKLWNSVSLFSLSKSAAFIAVRKPLNV